LAFSILREHAVERNDGYLLYELGSALKAEKNMPSFEEKAFEMFKKASDLGEENAYFELGLCFAYGNGVKKNKKEAKKYLSMASKAGTEEADDALLDLEKDEEGGDEDDEEHKMESEEEERDSVVSDGFETEEYNLMSEDGCFSFAMDLKLAGEFEKAFEQFKKLSDFGVDRAHYEVGLCYACGLGVEKDVDEAINYLSMALSSGIEEAQHVLTKLENGDNVSVIDEQELASEQEQESSDENLDELNESDYNLYSADGCFALAMDYKDHGQFEKAFELFKRLSEFGFPRAHYEVGLCYFYGHGVNKDKEEAMKYLMMAMTPGEEKEGIEEAREVLIQLENGSDEEEEELIPDDLDVRSLSIPA